MKKKSVSSIAVVALSVAIALGATAPANAAETSYPAGGKWVHGFSGMSVISNYYHGWRTHRSSVTTNYAYYNSGWKSPGLWSYASLQQSWYGNKANYDYI